MKSRLMPLVCLLGALFITVPVFASEGVPWDQLSESQKQVLKSFANRWQDLSPEQLQKYRKVEIVMYLPKK